MKRVIKQPCLWIALLSIVLAVATAVGSSILYPRIPVIDKLEKGLNQGKAEKVIACFAPEAQEAVRVLAGFEEGAEDSLPEGIAGVEEGMKLNILYGELSESEDGTAEVQSFVLVNQAGSCVEADCNELELEEADGKYYLSFY